MSAFSPVTGLFGGSLIGLSAATLLLFSGDILGASGIASSFILTPRKTLTESSQQWKLSFMAAFLLTVRAYTAYVDGDALVDKSLGVDPKISIVSPLGYIVSGFLVGFGTRMGNGCTSGHGICGLARLSKRSFVAVCSFMASGILSATACSPSCPLSPYLRGTAEDLALPTAATSFIGSVLTTLFCGMALPRFFQEAPTPASDTDADKIRNDDEINNVRKLGPGFASGSLFALGLIISGMVKSSKIYGFLNFKGFADGSWDGTLMFVMGGGLVVSMASYQFVKGFGIQDNANALTCPLALKKSTGKFSVPTNKVIDANLVFGAAIFGFGWGIGGLCPGPAIANAAVGYPHILFRWWPAFFAGSFLGQKLKDLMAKKK